MKDTPEIPEADCAPGARHPRFAPNVIGQDQAQSEFLRAFNSGRLHHAWLITGPKGIGKATLAWRIARFLLTTPDGDDGLFGAPPPPENLDGDPNDPAQARISALSDPGLFLLRRGWDEKRERLRADILVDDVRKMRDFFSLSVTDGGRRVVIVDAADEMNVNAANALLKQLEEPPSNTTLLLVCHQPTRILPTIRSRCRTLRCFPLASSDIARILQDLEMDLPDATQAAGLSELAAGSAGAALRLMALDGLEIYADILALFQSGLNRPDALKFAESMAGRGNADRLAITIELFDLFLTRLARSGVQGPPEIEACPGEARLMARLCGSPVTSRIWAETQSSISQRAQHGIAVNLDPAALVLDMLFKIDEVAALTAT